MSTRALQSTLRGRARGQQGTSSGAKSRTKVPTRANNSFGRWLGGDLSRPTLPIARSITGPSPNKEQASGGAREKCPTEGSSDDASRSSAGDIARDDFQFLLSSFGNRVAVTKTNFLSKPIVSARRTSRPKACAQEPSIVLGSHSAPTIAKDRLDSHPLRQPQTTSATLLLNLQCDADLKSNERHQPLILGNVIENLKQHAEGQMNSCRTAGNKVQEQHSTVVSGLPAASSQDYTQHVQHQPSLQVSAASLIGLASSEQHRSSSSTTRQSSTSAGQKQVQSTSETALTESSKALPNIQHQDRCSSQTEEQNAMRMNEMKTAASTQHIKLLGRSKNSWDESDTSAPVALQQHGTKSNSNLAERMLEDHYESNTRTTMQFEVSTDCDNALPRTETVASFTSTANSEHDANTAQHGIEEEPANSQTGTLEKEQGEVRVDSFSVATMSKESLSTRADSGKSPSLVSKNQSRSEGDRVIHRPETRQSRFQAHLNMMSRGGRRPKLPIEAPPANSVVWDPSYQEVPQSVAPSFEDAYWQIMTGGGDADRSVTARGHEDELLHAFPTHVRRSGPVGQSSPVVVAKPPLPPAVGNRHAHNPRLAFQQRSSTRSPMREASPSRSPRARSQSPQRRRLVSRHQPNRGESPVRDTHAQQQPVANPRPGQFRGLKLTGRPEQRGVTRLQTAQFDRVSLADNWLETTNHQHNQAPFPGTQTGHGFNRPTVLKTTLLDRPQQTPPITRLQVDVRPERMVVTRPLTQTPSLPPVQAISILPKISRRRASPQSPE